jgi:methanogenic corrinoid protein MtbC1
VTELVNAALTEDVSASDILNKGLIPGMDIVGGAPVTQAFAEEIGAGGFVTDAGSAARLAKSYVA